MGKRTCRKCGGKGYVRCPKCHGTGTVNDGRDNCPVCTGWLDFGGGKGVVKCESCNGLGAHYD